MRARPGHRLGRFTATTVALCVLAGIGAGPALADLSELTSTVDQLTTTVSETAAPVTQDATTLLTPPAAGEPAPAAESPAPADAATQGPLDPLSATVEQTTAPLTSSVQSAVAPVTQTTEPLVAPVQQTVEDAVTVVQQTAAPVVTTVEQVTAPVLQTTETAVAQVVQTTEQVVAPLLDTTQQVIAPIAATTQELVAPLTAAKSDGSSTRPAPPAAVSGLEAGRSDGGPTVSPVGMEQGVAADELTAGWPQQASPGFAAGAARPAGTSVTRDSSDAPSIARPALLPAAAGPFDAARSSTGTDANPAREPLPSAPGVPFGFTGSAASSAGGNLFVPLFALAAAMLLLAAQEVGRRLRPTVASPRLPKLALSLERPG